jgi:hypothetical protein
VRSAHRAAHACWDLNGNGTADPEEDANGDGVASGLDCMGPRGADGADGNAGATGPAGSAGVASNQCPANSLFAMREPWVTAVKPIHRLAKPLHDPCGDAAG